MAEERAWVLNLDAELELGARGHYQPSDAVAGFVAAHAESALKLLGPRDVLVRAESRLNPAESWIGRAWCPTPRALAQLTAAGATPEPAPPVEVLRAVNDRAFAARLAPGLAGAGYANSRAELEALLAARPEIADWRLKRAFGVAGRGQRSIRPAARLEADGLWIERSLALGGLRVEPEVEIAIELATHGFIEPQGALRVGPPTVQTTGPDGAWRSTLALEPAGLPPGIEGELTRTALRVAEALRAAGYFGPFGVDAFLWRDAQGALVLNPLSELNARYTLGWAHSFPTG